MIKDDKETNDLKGVWSQLCNNESIKVKEVMNKMMENKSEICMKKSLMQGNLAYWA